MTVNLSKINKFDTKKSFITSSNLPTGEIRKPLDLNIDNEKQSKKSINPATAGFIIKTHKNKINNLNSQSNDLILKKVNKDLTIEEKRKIDDEVDNILKEIKMNEYEIHEVKEKLKNSKDEKFKEIEPSNNTKTNELPKKMINLTFLL